ncbi:hypothetical protein EVAR_51801_1 [Eumeta japonica]|uniref:Uncharacterized protein n=1 Tax=Eumeta variegata TaxID=151549 RepID=A0A4C2A4K2_EUMVA|nr:hypothetical protein EVAR_51801_1 [Eumeta japonica]
MRLQTGGRQRERRKPLLIKFSGTASDRSRKGSARAVVAARHVGVITLAAFPDAGVDCRLCNCLHSVSSRPREIRPLSTCLSSPARTQTHRLVAPLEIFS